MIVPDFNQEQYDSHVLAIARARASLSDLAPEEDEAGCNYVLDLWLDLVEKVGLEIDVRPGRTNNITGMDASRVRVKLDGEIITHCVAADRAAGCAVVVERDKNGHARSRRTDSDEIEYEYRHVFGKIELVELPQAELVAEEKEL